MPTATTDKYERLLCIPRDASFPLATIDHLPVELLIEIFTRCADDIDDYPLGAVYISQVCQFWRNIVRNSPHAWQRISLNGQRSVVSSRAQVDLWSELSRGRPLDIHINISEADNLLPVVSPLLEHIRRWRKCIIRGRVVEDIDFAAFSEDGSLASLNKLSITVKDPSPGTHPPEHATPRPNAFERISPLHPGLHSRFHYLGMNAEVTNLAFAPRMSPFSLRWLIVRESSQGVVPEPFRFVQLLSYCQSLEVLEYIGFPRHGEAVPAVFDGAIPTAHLPFLRTLVLHSTCAVRAILSHIHAPALTELYLEHTNMEFELRHAATHLSQPEEGDSDDEACDFSQSPSSDLATGMGLRSFIRRSNPPLEVLGMDYADMRTKDFRWCFERLKTLQEFRIVASDMSDKVVALLAPFSPHDDADDSGMDVDRETPPLASHKPLEVRMPKLSVIELWNCQRLSGDAMVHALAARTRYTDEVADRNAYSRLSEVAVINCPNFAPRHVMSLSSVLGTRLRTTTG